MNPKEDQSKTSALKPKTVVKTKIIYVEKPLINSKQSKYNLNGFKDKNEAQNKIVNGNKQGKWLIYLDENSNLIDDRSQAKYYQLATFRDGKKIGIVRIYFMTGNIFREIPYTNEGDVIEGICRKYYISGQLEYEAPYTNGVIHGLAIYYYENGKLKMEVPYLNDMYNGVWRSYFESGQLDSERPHINGKVDGVSIEYNEDGTLKYKYRWKDGIIGERVH
jgi:antitoxin component YwqK of YwqJK toxin-antitoxin module